MICKWVRKANTPFANIKPILKEGEILLMLCFTFMSRAKLGLSTNIANPKKKHIKDSEVLFLISCAGLLGIHVGCVLRTVF